jgi:hypothetical protein
MNRNNRWPLILSLALLATSCTFYHVKNVDGKALAAKRPKGQIVGVYTANDAVAFSADDPAVVEAGAVVGTAHLAYMIDPFDIADISPALPGPNVVLKDGTRFRAAESRPAGNAIACEALRTVYVPLDEVVRADIRSVDHVASVLGSIAGVALFAASLGLEGDEDSGWDEEEYDPVEDLVGELICCLLEPDDDLPATPASRRSNRALLDLADGDPAAAATEFWTVNWAPVDARPGEDGRSRVELGNLSGVPRGIDEARLVVVDHAPGVRVAADALDGLRAFAAPVAPDSAVDGEGKDILGPVAAADGLLWRSTGGEPAPDKAASARDELSFSFPRPKGARKAKLVVSASNSAWPALFAREAAARAQAAGPEAPTGDAYRNWEFGKIRVRMLTVIGWQTAQALFAGGPLPAVDRIYDLDLGDVGADKVSLELAPPAGYWLFDRLALDFGEDLPFEAVELAAEAVEGPDAAEVLAALEAEDGTTLRLDAGGAPALLTFILPPPKEGQERSVFLRTVSCYEMPPLGEIHPPASRR